MNSNLTSIVYLRGLAAMMVMFYHHARRAVGIPSFFIDVTEYGQLGVHVFFIISGVVIPLQLQRHNYKYSDIGHFFANRLARIYPCFLVVLFGATAVWQLQYMVIGGTGPVLTVENITQNLFLMVNVLGGTTFLSVAWTLLIEFSYYIVLGLLFPVMFKGSDLRFFLFSIGLLGLSLLGAEDSQFVNFFKWSPFFIAGFALYVGLTRSCWKYVIPLIGMSLGFIVFRGGHHEGWVQALVCLATILTIMFLPKFESKSLSFLGLISFSIYLVHGPIGHKVFGVYTNFFEESQLGAWIALFASMLLSLSAAAFTYYLVEKPSHNWSKALWKKKTSDDRRVSV